MKKIVPFKKDITFESNIHEITSISLEHTLSLKEENIVKGSFIISGTYKMTDTSVNIDEFNFDLPFEINIDKKYDTKNINLDINDFYYELIDSRVLAVNIEVSIDDLEEKEEKEVEEVRNEKNQEIEEFKEVEELLEEPKETENKEKNNETTSLFDNLDDAENYVTYKIHVVNENDTVESIIQKYEVTLSKIEEYNDVSEIKIGDKIIVPIDD